jgi:hypothetical protein
MIAALLSRLGGWSAAPLATAAAIAFAAAFIWQSARIDGWPLVGGGLKAQVATLEQQIAAAQLSDANAAAAVLMARQKAADAANGEARAHLEARAASESRIRTIIKRVPVYVSAKSDSACVVPWGFVRLFDAAASGADPDFVAAAVAPGQPDDAPSDVTLSEAVALLATDLGHARQNADQLAHLEKAVAAP